MVIDKVFGPLSANRFDRYDSSIDVKKDTQSVESKVAATIASRKLIDKDSLVLVAVSGGPDSTVLLLALHRLGYKLHVGHVNHGLRAESVNEAEHVRQFCERLGVPITVAAVDVAGKRAAHGGGIQEVARRLRYEFLERTATDIGAAVIATGHNKDDRVETVMLNIIRGTGMGGLRGIPYKRGKIVRPLLDVSRAEIEAYCLENGIHPVRDPSNDSSKYSRNEVRNFLIPYLKDRFNAHADDAILRLSEIAADEDEYLDGLARQWVVGSKKLDQIELAKESIALQRRILQIWLTEVCRCEDITQEHIEAIRSKIPWFNAVTFPGNVRIIGDVYRELAPWSSHDYEERTGEVPIPVTVPGTLVFGKWMVEAYGSLPQGLTATVRTWRDGDRMWFPFGRKKLSDIFNEAKWPRERRWLTPLLVDSETNEVLAIANLKVSPMCPELKFTAAKSPFPQPPFPSE